MAGTIDQVLNSKNEDGSGMVTVIAVDDRGYQHSATREYSNYGYEEQNAVQRATQDALDKC